MSNKNVVTKTFSDAVDDAKLLLAFASKNGIKLDKDTLEIIVKTKPGEALSIDEEVKFWGAFNVLTHAVSPATTESLHATTSRAELSHKILYWWPWASNKTMAERTTLNYTIAAAISLFLLLVLNSPRFTRHLLLINLSK